MSPAETAWQAMHLVDVAQTINGPALDPCYAEGTSTRLLIGDQPEPGAVVAWGIAIGVAHYYAAAWLDRSSLPDGVKIAARSIDLGYKGATIANNHRIGVRPFGENDCPWRQP